VDSGAKKKEGAASERGEILAHDQKSKKKEKSAAGVELLLQLQR